MQTVLAPRGDARTFLTHFVGGGLDDDRYVIQRFKSLADGDIVPVRADGKRPKGRRKARTTIASLKAVEKMRPARDEIIIATGDQAARLWGPALGLARNGHFRGSQAERMNGVLLRTSCRPAAGRASARSDSDP